MSKPDYEVGCPMCGTHHQRESLSSTLPDMNQECARKYRRLNKAEQREVQRRAGRKF